MKEDLIQLLLYLAKEQSLSEIREDVSDEIHILISVPETVTCSDEMTSVRRGTHPVKWSDGAKWGQCTWG